MPACWRSRVLPSSSQRPRAALQLLSHAPARGVAASAGPSCFLPPAKGPAPASSPAQARRFPAPAHDHLPQGVGRPGADGGDDVGVVNHGGLTRGGGGGAGIGGGPGSVATGTRNRGGGGGAHPVHWEKTRGGGSRVWHKVSCHEGSDLHVEPVGWAGAAHDVTSRREAAHTT